MSLTEVPAPRRLGSILTTVLIALVSLLLTGTPAHAAATAKVNTWGAPANLRSGPGTGYTVVGSLANDTSVTIQCTASGTNVEGPYGWSTVWDSLGGGRWIADALVYTGTMDPVAPACSGASGIDPSRYPWPATDTWVADGSGYYAGECTSFAAWAVRNDGIPSRSPDWRGNADMWDDNRSTVTVSSTPRVGDVAQWDAYRNGAGSAGHVAYVSAIRADGTVQVMEYNWGSFHRYNTRSISASNPSRYLRF